MANYNNEPFYTLEAAITVFKSKSKATILFEERKSNCRGGIEYRGVNSEDCSTGHIYGTYDSNFNECFYIAFSPINN